MQLVSQVMQTFVCLCSVTNLPGLLGALADAAAGDLLPAPGSSRYSLLQITGAILHVNFPRVPDQIWFPISFPGVGDAIGRMLHQWWH